MTIDFNYQHDFSEQAEREILSMLKAQGFSMPHDDWLRAKLHDITNRFHWAAESRKKDTHQATVDAWRRTQDAVSTTIRYLDSQRFELSTATEIVAGLPDSWDDEQRNPMTDAELEAALVPAEFTVGEVEIAKRVLERLLANATDLAGALENWLDRRPAKNEQPEIDGLIRGLARLWCAAFKVPIARIKISESSGSPAASFIEAGVTMFLGKTLSRKSIVTHVIAYRDEEKAKLS